MSLTTEKEIDDFVLQRPTVTSCFPFPGVYVVDYPEAVAPHLLTVFYGDTCRYKAVAPDWITPVEVDDELCQELTSVKRLVPTGWEPIYTKPEYQEELKAAEAIVKRATFFQNIAGLFKRS